jgi:hypothetical protein
MAAHEAGPSREASGSAGRKARTFCAFITMSPPSKENVVTVSYGRARVNFMRPAPGFWCTLAAMKTWVPIVLSTALAASLGLASIASAQPQPPRPRPMPPPPMQPLPPAPPGIGAPLPPNEYQTRLQRDWDARLAQRAAQRRNAAQWESSRAQRELEHRRQLEGVWGAAFLRRPECQPELALDADREARLDRMIDLAQDAHDAASEARARAILAREFARHARAMAALRARWGGQ